MKYTLILLTLLAIFPCLFSQQDAPRNMKFIPQGSFEFVKGSDSMKISVDAFWMSDEISNKEYREFINDIKQHPDESLGIFDSEKFIETKSKKNALTMYSYRDILKEIIDTSVWNSDKKFKNYFNNPKYDDYPVVGVSYSNAVFYCVWRTRIENESNESKGLPYVMDSRLPLEAEWYYVAAVSDDKNTKVAAKVKSGKKNKYGLYNFNSNVSEWTATSIGNGEKVIKGGSWKTERKFSDRIAAKPDFRDNATGFRIVKTYMSNK